MSFRYINQYNLKLEIPNEPQECQLKLLGRKNRKNDCDCDVKPHKCNCKCFKEQNHLKIHERIHKDEKPFQCKYCEKGFRQLSNLKGHSKQCNAFK